MQVEDQRPNDIRRAIHAGKIYPADPVKLSELLEQRILATTRPPEAKGDIRSIVTPFSIDWYREPIELGALRALNRHNYSSVIIVATAQNLFFDFAAIYSGGAYDTPLGRVFLDLELCRRLANLHPTVRMAARGHEGGKDAEFAIESLLPWLQKLLGNFRLVPIVAGSDSLEMAIALGEVLAHPDAREALVIACTQIELSADDSESARKWKRAEAAFSAGEFRTLADLLASAMPAGLAGMLSLAYAHGRRGSSRTTVIEIPIAGTTFFKSYVQLSNQV
jgi:AmmeMemoRadiSam system protein B